MVENVINVAYLIMGLIYTYMHNLHINCDVANIF